MRRGAPNDRRMESAARCYRREASGNNDKLTRRQGNTDFHFCTAVPPWLSGEVPGYVFLNIFPSEVPATVSGKLQEELLLVASVSKMPDIAPYIMSISRRHGNYSFRRSILHQKNATLRMKIPVSKEFYI